MAPKDEHSRRQKKASRSREASPDEEQPGNESQISSPRLRRVPARLDLGKSIADKPGAPGLDAKTGTKRGSEERVKAMPSLENVAPAKRRQSKESFEESVLRGMAQAYPSPGRSDLQHKRTSEDLRSAYAGSSSGPAKQSQSAEHQIIYEKLLAVQKDIAFQERGAQGLPSIRPLAEILPELHVSEASSMDTRSSEPSIDESRLVVPEKRRGRRSGKICYHCKQGASLELGTLVACRECAEWFHAECDGESSTDKEDPKDGDYICLNCDQIAAFETEFDDLSGSEFSSRSDPSSEPTADANRVESPPETDGVTRRLCDKCGQRSNASYGTVVQCNRCSHWFHIRCGGQTGRGKSVLKDGDYTCLNCKGIV